MIRIITRAAVELYLAAASASLLPSSFLGGGATVPKRPNGPPDAADKAAGLLPAPSGLILERRQQSQVPQPRPQTSIGELPPLRWTQPTTLGQAEQPHSEDS